MNTAPVIKEDGKGYRRTAVVLMALVFASLLLVSIAPASDAETNGECGTDLTWALTENADSPGTYTLTISGTGTVMDDYTDVDRPGWYESRSTVTNLVLPAGLTHIGDYAFYAFSNLTTTNISELDSLETVGDYAFSNTRLTAVDLSRTAVTYVGDNAFWLCRGLTSVYLPSTVTTIGVGAFTSTGLTSINFEDLTSLETIGASAFASTSLISVDLSNTRVVTIPDGTFNYNSSLTTVDMPGVKSIAPNAFTSCSGLLNLKVSIGCDIPDSAITGCASLMSVKMGEITLPVTNGSVQYRTAAIGGMTYDTLEAAFAAAQGGETIDLLEDTDVSGVISVTANVTLVLNGHTITNNVQNDRLFNVTSSGFKVDGTTAGSEMVIPKTNTQSYGFIKVSAKSVVTLEGGSYSGDTDNGAFVKIIRDATGIDASGSTVYFNDVTMESNGRFFDTNTLLTDASTSTLEITGGTYTSDIQAFHTDTLYLSPVIFTDVTVNVVRGPCIEASGSALELNDCYFEVKNTSTQTHYQATAVSVSYMGSAVIDGGTYKSTGYGIYVYSSGGTITLLDGTVYGGEAAVRADVDSNTYPTATAEIVVEGGSTDGVWETNGNEKAKLVAKGGTHTKDVSQYLDPGYKQNADGSVDEAPDYELTIAYNHSVEKGDSVTLTVTDNAMEGTMTYLLTLGDDIIGEGKTIIFTPEATATYTLTISGTHYGKTVSETCEIPITVIEHVTLTFNYPDGKTNKIQAVKGEPVSDISVEDPVRTGFDFVRWQAADGKPYDGYVPTGDTEFNPVWNLSAPTVDVTVSGDLYEDGVVVVTVTATHPLDGQGLTYTYMMHSDQEDAEQDSNVFYIRSEGEYIFGALAFYGDDTSIGRYSGYVEVELNVPETPDPPFVPGGGDDDYVPLPPTIVVDDSSSSDDDEAVKIAACAAAAVAAAIIALILVAEYRKR